MPLSADYREWLQAQLKYNQPSRFDSLLGPEHKLMSLAHDAENLEAFLTTGSQERVLWRFTHILLILESDGGGVC